MKEQHEHTQPLGENSGFKKNDVLLRPLIPMNTSIFTNKVLIIFAVVILLGIASGFFLSKNGGKVGAVNMSKMSGSTLPQGTTVGSNDMATFKDTAEGVVKSGGIEGEGQFHLVRPGGDSQNVYMTSSIVDLSGFIGKKVKVWGQTQTAKKAGWLMDVGKVQVE